MKVDGVDVHAFTVPVDGPDGVEQDGTLEWDSTTMVLVQVHGGGVTGSGYTYGDVSTATMVESKLAPLVRGADASDPPALWRRMFAAIRNAGRPGAGAMAVSAVDIALWDLRARSLGVPLFRALPAFHDQVPVYGSGGFTNYLVDQLVDQLTGWVSQGIGKVKLKTSREPGRDPLRLAAVRDALGDEPGLLVDANGALDRKQALYWAHRFAGDWGVCWFEEPVSSDDPTGLRLVRDHGPGGLDVAAGEYGYVLADFAQLLGAGAVDCLQADVTRCGGVTGLLEVAGLTAAHQMDLSAHCAPAASAHAFCAVRRLRHLEYFHDHVRVEGIAFDGTLTPEGGMLRPDPERPGLGLEVRWSDLEPYRVHGARREGGSMACGEQALLPAVREAGESTMVVADGFSCSTQIEDAGTGRTALHTGQVLALARDGGPPPGRPRPRMRTRILRTGAVAVAAAAGLAAAAWILRGRG